MIGVSTNYDLSDERLFGRKLKIKPIGLKEKMIVIKNKVFTVNNRETIEISETEGKGDEYCL